MRTLPVKCFLKEEREDCKGCGYTEDLQVDKDTESKKPLGVCPKCGGFLYLNWSAMNIGISMKGPGFHSTKIGQKRKREMIARNERLKKSQWEQFNPDAVKYYEEMKTPINPTPGGPLDPNGPFAKKKKPKIYT